MRNYAAENQAYLTYRQCCRRLELAAGAPDCEGLRRRWPTLGDCNRDMTAAYAAMGEEHRKYCDDYAKADAALLDIGLI